MPMLRFLRSDPPYLPHECAWFNEDDARRLLASGAAEVVKEPPAPATYVAPEVEPVTKPMRTTRRKAGE